MTVPPPSSESTKAAMIEDIKQYLKMRTKSALRCLPMVVTTNVSCRNEGRGKVDLSEPEGPERVPESPEAKMQHCPTDAFEMTAGLISKRDWLKTRFES